MTLARLIDNKVGIILDAAASICGPGGSQATRLMTQYDCANGWRIANITPHVPVWDKSERPDGAFSRSDFVLFRQSGLDSYGRRR